MVNTKEPRQGPGVPFVMHLERVCRLIDMGAHFGAIEFHPYSDLGDIRGTIVRNVALRICDGGGVSITTPDGISISAFGLALSNYKRLWRIWQNGIPTDAQRAMVKWG